MTQSSNANRTLLFTLAAGTELPDGLSPLLEDEAVAAGVLRGHGIVEDATLRVYSPLAGGMGTTRTLAGESQLVVLDGTIGMASGHPTATLRAVVARETEMGLETWAGTLVAARVVEGELVVHAFDDLAIALDPGARPPPAPVSGPAPAPRAAPAAAPVERASGWAEAARASATAGPAPGPKAPPRPPSRPNVEDDSPFPEGGDLVDHFAFGACEVLKSDGDRIHLKVGKDGRIREIALEMLKVTLQSAPDEKPRRFRLERKL
jgi:predicted DNA-binding protein with PD1-like motif